MYRHRIRAKFKASQTHLELEANLGVLEGDRALRLGFGHLSFDVLVRLEQDHFSNIVGRIRDPVAECDRLHRVVLDDRGHS